MAKNILFLILASIILFISGCATPRSTAMRMERPTDKGTYHLVKKGETLWRIAKNYNLDIADLAKANKLPDITKITTGQLLFIPKPGETIRAVNNAAYFGKQNFIWPLEGEVASFFGAVNDGIRNKGIDINAKEGDPVKSSRDGKIIFCDEKVKGLGKTIIIDHGDEFSTVYAHNSEILVKVGNVVKQGDIIARAGSSGRAEMAHLHFEIRKKHEPQNPFYYLP